MNDQQDQKKFKLFGKQKKLRKVDKNGQLDGFMILLE